MSSRIVDFGLWKRGDVPSIDNTLGDSGQDSLEVRKVGDSSNQPGAEIQYSPQTQSMLDRIRGEIALTESRNQKRTQDKHALDELVGSVLKNSGVFIYIPNPSTESIDVIGPDISAKDVGYVKPTSNVVASHNCVPASARWIYDFIVRANPADSKIFLGNAGINYVAAYSASDFANHLVSDRRDIPFVTYGVLDSGETDFAPKVGLKSKTNLCYAKLSVPALIKLSDLDPPQWQIIQPSGSTVSDVSSQLLEEPRLVIVGTNDTVIGVINHLIARPYQYGDIACTLSKRIKFPVDLRGRLNLGEGIVMKDYTFPKGNQPNSIYLRNDSASSSK